MSRFQVDAVEISSEDERATPTKPGEEPLTTSQEDAPTAIKTTPPTPNDQEEEADKVAEGLDLLPRRNLQHQPRRSIRETKMRTSTSKRGNGKERTP